MHFLSAIQRVLVVLLYCADRTAALISSRPVSELLKVHAADIEQLKAETAKIVVSVDQEPYSNDVFYLRYCLDEDDDDDDGGSSTPLADQLELLRDNLAWRLNEGKTLCDAAAQAVSKAQSSSDGAWDNAAVYSAAPHVAKLSAYISPRQAITCTSSADDLVYCIRAGQIDDNALMAAVTVDEMVDFFLYAKEVNSIVANHRSRDTDKLLSVVTVNDLSGIQLLGGSKDFRTALSQSSKRATNLYPSTAGPSLLLNLPPLVSALVKLFTPLFPPKVNKRLKFADCKSIKSCDSLVDVATANGSLRKEFLRELDDILEG